MTTAVTPETQDYWTRFLAATGRAADTPLYEAFYFGDSAELADELSALVLSGQKRATASLLWEYEAEGRRPPKAGDLNVVTDFAKKPLFVVETVHVDIVPFDDVTAEFAATEGEGDSSLAWWRGAHWDYFGRVCERLGRTIARDMPVVCEEFRIVEWDA